MHRCCGPRPVEEGYDVSPKSEKSRGQGLVFLRPHLSVTKSPPKRVKLLWRRPTIPCPFMHSQTTRKAAAVCSCCLFGYFVPVGGWLLDPAAAVPCSASPPSQTRWAEKKQATN
ncbi:hypothetical protein LX32DRAFT_405605 [Colletotrichum zoysiae]|uniref:Uncharacterized protein n=1 Tax=Colletotrichum zoysiae TaxID=1216348 RepID=A0AAD9LZE1_9PEZI|nr:hypothetical protein LX32DRAFT_405605 [Colletotrichum zoysiae]